MVARIMALGLGLGCAVALLWLAANAMLADAHTIDWNRYGEGWPEVVLFLVCAVVLAWQIKVELKR